VQIRHFIVSHTEFGYGNYPPHVVRALLEKRLGVRGDYFAPAAEVRRRQAGETGYDDAVMVFRTALMNPFTLEKVQDGKDYIDLFLEELPGFLQRAQA